MKRTPRPLAGLLKRTLCILAGALILGGARADTRLTISFTGDVTLGCQHQGSLQSDAFDAYAKKKGYGYFFAKVLPILSADDLTLVNLEGPLTDSSRQENREKTFRFRGATDYVEILRQGSIEACALANNHIQDFGRQGYQSTLDTLARAGIRSCGYEESFVWEKEGARVGFFSFHGSWLKEENSEEIASRMARMRREGVGAIVCCFHMGQEYSATRRKWDQERIARKAIETWGADLVIMHHPHVLQGMDRMDGHYVFYSLGNFVFGGNTTIHSNSGNRQIRTLETAIVQMDLFFDEEGVYLGQQGRIYPCYSSSTARKAGDPNDYCPKRVRGAQARGVLERIQADTPFDLGGLSDEDIIVLPYLSAPGQEGRTPDPSVMTPPTPSETPVPAPTAQIVAAEAPEDEEKATPEPTATPAPTPIREEIQIRRITPEPATPTPKPTKAPKPTPTATPMEVQIRPLTRR